MPKIGPAAQMVPDHISYQDWQIFFAHFFLTFPNLFYKQNYNTFLISRVEKNSKKAIAFSDYDDDDASDPSPVDS